MGDVTETASGDSTRIAAILHGAYSLMSTKKQVRGIESPTADVLSKSQQTPARPKPLVFISHDTRDADIAEAFSNLLQDASGGVLRSFRSSDRKGTAGIEFGAEWYSAIMDKLKDATDVVALLTSQSLGRPWLLYEAGVAKGRLDTVVFGVALGVPLENVGIGPFAQFQNSSDDEDSLTKLVMQLIRRNPDANPREEAVRRQVMAFRESASQLLARRPAASTLPPPELDASAVARLFEEVKVMFRQLPDQVEMSLERRLRDVRSALGPTLELDRYAVGSLFRRLHDSPLGDDKGWRLLASLIGRTSPILHRQLVEMSDAWGKSDAKRIASAREGLMRTLSEEDRHILPLPDQEHFGVLRDVLQTILFRMAVFEPTETKAVRGKDDHDKSSKTES